MAAGNVKSTRYTDPSSPFEKSFSRTFSASARTITTATQAEYDGPPTGYCAVFAGFYTNTSVLLLNLFNPNAVDDDSLITNRNISSSSQSSKPIHFHCSYIRSDIVQDERES